MAVILSGCGADTEDAGDKDISPELKYVSSLETEYAENFSVDFYDGGYSLVTVSDGSRFLIVPKDISVPETLDSDITVLKQPVENIYIVASAAMSSFAELNALDRIRFSGTKQSDWYIEEAAAAMSDGSIIYAGKYNAPDYEKLLSEGCGLCIQNTMILHTPSVKENIEKLGIPVIMDYSSYESEPLGRCEWIKLYGVLTDRLDEAVKIFDVQKALAEQVTDSVSVGNGSKPSVAYFYINSNGNAVVRKGNDYIPKMIEMAGGEYVFSELGTDDENASSSVNMQMETFYAEAHDADYLIYNSTVDGEISSVEELIAKSPLLADFRAVKEGNVYCTGKNFYQETNVCGEMVRDLYAMFNGGEDMSFIRHVV
jgi:iron complex transport system substrate-binding protein